MRTIKKNYDTYQVYDDAMRIINKQDEKMMVDINLLLEYGGSLKEVKKDEIICQEGEIALFYFQLVKGRLKWRHVDDDGKEFIHEFVDEGDSFGVGPLFDEQPYDASVVSEEPSTLLRLKLPLFHQMLKDHPEIHFRFTKLLAERLRYRHLLIKLLAHCDPEYRLITLLNYLIQHKKNVCFVRNRLLLTRKELASMVGLRVETVIRTIKQLEQKKLISIDKGKVYLSNMTRITSH